MRVSSDFDVSIEINGRTAKNGHKVYLPSHVDYKIKVTNLKDDYFKIRSCLVGGRKVSGFEGIYFPDSATISGFKPKSKESFFFMATPNSSSSSSDKEKSTIILKLQKYKRCVDMRQYEMEMQCTSSGYDLDGDEIYGITVNGGNYVDQVQTAYTTDTFEKVGEEEEVSILLVCSDAKEIIKRKKKVGKHENTTKQQLKRLREEIEEI
jgi:hypothetical protein